MSVAAVLTAAMTPAWGAAAIIMTAILFGGTASAFIPVVFAEIARRSPADQVGALTSGGQLFLQGGALVGPLIFGFASQWGFAVAFLGLGFCSLLGALLMAVPQRRYGSRAARAAGTDSPGS